MAVPPVSPGLDRAHPLEDLRHKASSLQARLFAAYSIVFVAVAAWLPPIHDYRAYLQQWDKVADGKNPWLTFIPLGVNAYGPLHILYGMLALLSPMLPRVLGAVLWLIAVWPVVDRVVVAPLSIQRRIGLVGLLVLNPFVWGWVPIFGSNDAIVAACLGLAFLCLVERASISAGVLVGLAALMKFYPFLLVPFIAVDRRRIDIPFVLAAVGTFGAGMAIAGDLWGSSIFVPIFFASGREPSQLSLYAFLTTSRLSPLYGTVVPATVTQIVFAVAGTAAFLAHILRRADQRRGLLLGLLTILTAYQLGHFQFYLPLVLLVPLHVVDWPDASAARWLLYLLIVTSFFATCYLAFGGLVDPPWLYIRQNAGLPTFLIASAAIIALLRAEEPQA